MEAMDIAETQRGPCIWTSPGGKLYKGLRSPSFWLGGHNVSAATTHLCCCSEKAAQATCKATAGLGSNVTLLTKTGCIGPTGHGD